MPKSPYGLSKLSGEHLLSMNYEEHSIPYVAFRMFNIFGPFQSVSSAYASVIPIFFSKALQDENLGIHGDGEQTRDFVFVEEVVQYYIQAMSSDVCGVFNLGSGTSMDINSLAERILKITGKMDLKVSHTTPRPGDIRHSKADVSSLCGNFQFIQPDFGYSLQRTFEYYKSIA